MGRKKSRKKRKKKKLSIKCNAERQMPVPYGSKLSIPPTNDHLLAGHQEQYKNKKQKLHKKHTRFFNINDELFI